jgi:diguanylate cyclase (GGDEF)-like protein/PAS domain S-box-containing protein
MNLFAPTISGLVPGLVAAERTQSRSSRRTPIWLSAIGVIAAAATVALAGLAAFDADGIGSWINLTDDVALVFALIACVYASTRTTGDLRLMWRLLAAGVFFWTAGEAIYDIRVVGLGLGPSQSTATGVLYMTFYPFTVAGMMMRDRNAREGGFDIRMIDAVVVALAIAVVAYGVVFNNPLTVDAQSAGAFGQIGYPILLGILIWTITYQLSARTIVWDASRSLLACAVFGMFLSGVLWCMVGGIASGAAMSAAMALIGFAALASPTATRVQPPKEHERRKIAAEVVLFVAYAGVVAVLVSRFYSFDPVLTILAGIAMLVVVSRLVAAFAQNARLLESSERRAATDPLTGLSNLQHFRSRLDNEIARTKREGGHFALLLIDIDHFKSVNDIAGHRAGDQVLIQVAETMRETFRPFDVVCRIGGDELAVIAPHAGAREALQIAWRLCHAAREISIGEFPDLPPVSVSVGCCEFPTLAADATQLIDNADEALYRVKQNQRGGAELYTPDAPLPEDEGWQLARVRAQLAARDADFQAIFRHAREAMAIIDEKGTLLLVNDRATSMFGANREQIIGNRTSKFLDAAGVREFEGRLPQMSADGELDGKIELRTPGASESMTVEYSAARFAPDRFLTILRDVTEREREAAVLSENERRFRAVFDSSLDPIFVTDDEGLIRDANPAAATMTRRPLDELIGKRVDELVHAEEVGEVNEHVDELLDLKTARGTFTTRDEAGDLITVEYNSVANFVPGLHLTNVREITRDRTPAAWSAPEAASHAV